MFDFKIKAEKLIGLGEGDREIVLYDFNSGNSLIFRRNDDGDLIGESRKFNSSQSVLTQVIDDVHYPEITFLAREFKKIKAYRSWGIGAFNKAREPQSFHLSGDFLNHDGSNLAMVLNEIRMDLTVKERLLSELQKFYYGIVDYDVRIAGNLIHLVFHEKGLKETTSSLYMSDGTIHYLCLLSILLHNSPPELVIIEEPELGLHPDILPNLRRLLQEASEKCQIIITTHSNSIIDAFTDNPEAVLVSERTGLGTQIMRLNKKELDPWLEKYRLGFLWSRGDLGGTIW
jgi:predicted ATPase